MQNLISYEEAVGDAPAAPAPSPADGSSQPLTIRPGPAPATAQIVGSVPALPAGLASASSAPPSASPAQSPAPASTDSASRLISYEDATTPDTPHGGGALSNSADDGYASGAAKGTATGVIKGVGDAVGAVGGLGKLADYLIARVDAKITGRSVEAVQAANAAKAAATEADMVSAQPARDPAL